ncbi:TM2 domain-containing protein [Aureimonas jatrophae]|uniref:TM2 domain-containing protein n=1 Tax=Aureimonas jatrophae TaxID=1166073 RepID=UPI00182DD6C6|nr:TM2 domain-containing protein [Aureimonas jatrophae]MBB3952370.1 TM2 domain-containing membrane protein YozV [Aureimonas jatrophae]
MIIETRVGNDGPSVMLAYFLWFFVGILSAHRFYLGKPVSAILQILSYVILVGFIWLLVDAFLIPGMVRAKQEKIRRDLTLDAISNGRSLPAMQMA